MIQSSLVLGVKLNLHQLSLVGIPKLCCNLVGRNSTIHPLSWAGFPTFGAKLLLGTVFIG